MRRLLAAFLLLLPSLALAADIDPAVVGTWERVVAGLSGAGKAIWEIRADGTYAMRNEGAGPPPHSGSVTFSGGFWSLQSKGTGFFGNLSDKGTYRLDGPDTIAAIGTLGGVEWQRAGTVRLVRAAPPPAPVTIQWQRVGDQRVPGNLAALAEDATWRARTWRADAVLTDVLGRRSTEDPALVEIEFVFFSPLDNQAIAVAAALPRDKPLRELGAVQVPRGRLPDRTVELTAALTAARDAGMGAVGEARLGLLLFDRGARLAAWRLADTTEPKPATRYVDAFTGAFVDGDPADPARRSTAWSANAAAVERLMTAQLPRILPTPMGWIPPFGTSCNTGASCRAIQARDIDAASRLDGGLANAADLEKYAK